MGSDANKENAEAGGDGAAAEAEASQQISINYNAYMRTANLIVYFIRRKEGEDMKGLSQGELESLIMKEKEGDIESEEDMERENKLLKFIIHRLIEVDHILLIKEDDADDVTKRVLIVHPNYDPDSRNTANLGPAEQEADARAKAKAKEL